MRLDDPSTLWANGMETGEDLLQINILAGGHFLLLNPEFVFVVMAPLFGQGPFASRGLGVA